MENVLIGTEGWQHEAWLGSFYPEDLPEDWQLDYYSNLYRVLLVPYAVWSVWQLDDVEEIVEAMESPSYLYLSCEQLLEEKDWRKIQLLQQAMPELVAGLFFKLPASTDVEAAEICKSAEREMKARNLSLPITLLAAHYQLPQWNWSHQGRVLSGAPLAYISSLIEDGKAQAEIISSFMASLPAEQLGAPVIVGGEEVNMNAVANLKTVAELLGG